MNRTVMAAVMGAAATLLAIVLVSDGAAVALADGPRVDDDASLLFDAWSTRVEVGPEVARAHGLGDGKNLPVAAVDLRGTMPKIRLDAGDRRALDATDIVPIPDCGDERPAILRLALPGTGRPVLIRTVDKTFAIQDECGVDDLGRQLDPIRLWVDANVRFQLADQRIASARRVPSSGQIDVEQVDLRQRHVTIDANDGAIQLREPDLRPIDPIWSHGTCEPWLRSTLLGARSRELMYKIEFVPSEEDYLSVKATSVHC